MTLWIDTAVHRMWQPTTRKIASTGSIRGMDGWNRILEYKQSAQRQTGSDSGYRVYSLDFPKTLLSLSLSPLRSLVCAFVRRQLRDHRVHCNLLVKRSFESRPFVTCCLVWVFVRSIVKNPSVIVYAGWCLPPTSFRPTFFLP